MPASGETDEDGLAPGPDFAPAPGATLPPPRAPVDAPDPGAVAPVLAPGVSAPGVVVAGPVAAGVVVGAVAAAGAVATVVVAELRLVPSLPASLTRAAASTPNDSAVTTATTMIGVFQLGDAERRVRAAAPQRRHHSCSG
jgi:hypothetical protein